MATLKSRMLEHVSQSTMVWLQTLDCQSKYGSIIPYRVSHSNCKVLHLICKNKNKSEITFYNIMIIFDNNLIIFDNIIIIFDNIMIIFENIW